MTVTITSEALGRLRAAKATATKNSQIRESMAARDEVLARYTPQFQPDAIGDIPEETLRSFLYFENNRHWSGLNRQVNRVCADMRTTRTALAALVDESRPLESRIEPAAAIKGMGKGIITAILHVAYPDRYGVWNNTAEAGLVEVGLMPDFERGAGFGERYAAINEVLRQLATALDVDLWTLDLLWWNLHLDSPREAEGGDAQAEPPSGPLLPGASRSFALERHLHDYLFDSWDSLPLASEWEIFSRPGEPDAGYEFATPIGRIDLLAHHRRERRWLVIELKRQGSSDQVVGQVLRYIGWIRAHHAEPGETVDGLIIAHDGDDKLHYAVSAVPNLAFKTYEVEFRLKDVSTPPKT